MLTKCMFMNILLCLCIAVVSGSHFLGGTINWRIQNSSTGNASVAVLITQTYLWTYVPGRCDNNAIATNQPVAGSGGTLTCSPSCPSGFGSVSATPYCTDVSPPNGISVGQRSDVVLIPAGSNFSVIYASSAWGTLTSGGSAWSISSHINLVTRSDNGMFNNAPVATMMSPINIQANQKTLITVPVSDADGDTMRCRWATTSNGVDECGSVCSPGALPSNTIIYPNCTIEITGPVVGNKYAVALMVEDFINSSSTTPLSSVPVQFIVKVIAPPSCTLPPETMLTGQSCTPVKVNETFRSQLLGINHCGANVTIIDIATLSFSGMNQGPLTNLSSVVYYKNLTWTPTINQLGYQVMCAMALNSQNSQSSQYCFTFYVTENGTSTCPGIVKNSTISTTTDSTTISTTTNTTELSTISVSNKPSTSNCIKWPILASLIALAGLAMACNICLLAHYFTGCLNKRRQRVNDNETSKNPLTVAKISSTVAPTDPSNIVRNNNIHGPNIQQTSLNGTKTDNHMPRKVISDFYYPLKRIIRKSFNEPYVHIPSSDPNHNPAMINSKSNTSEALDKNKIHVTKIARAQLLNDSIELSPKSTKIRHVAKTSVRPYNGVSVEHINTTNNTAPITKVSDRLHVENEKCSKTKIAQTDFSVANVAIGYVPRPKE